MKALHFAAGRVDGRECRRSGPADTDKPVTSVWATYNGDHSGRRYSLLSQVNQSNVKNLALAWAFQAKSVPIKSTPLMVDGIIYFTRARQRLGGGCADGRKIWHYRSARGGDHIGHRGVAMYGNWLYFETPDCHLVASTRRMAGYGGISRWRIGSSGISRPWLRLS